MVFPASRYQDGIIADILKILWFEKLILFD